MFMDMLNKYRVLLKAHLGPDICANVYLRHMIRGCLDYIIYGSMVSDYFELKFYEKSHYHKKKYMTARDSIRFRRAFQSDIEGKAFSGKSALSLMYGKLLGRRQLLTHSMTLNEFMAFAKSHGEFLFKPDGGSCGRGIRKVILEEEGKLEDLYQELKREKGIIDEIIVQHSTMMRLHPPSLNTLRVFTLRFPGGVRIVAAALRMGRDNAIVDNYSAGGIIASVDIDRGIVTAAAEDMCGKRYAFHPTTDAQIIGFKVPYWSDIVALAKEAASIASIPYVGWDIAVREKDCVLVEGNHHPMVNTIQVADGGGKRVLFNQYLKLKQGIDTWPKS